MRIELHAKPDTLIPHSAHLRLLDALADVNPSGIAIVTVEGAPPALMVEVTGELAAGESERLAAAVAAAFESVERYCERVGAHGPLFHPGIGCSFVVADTNGATTYLNQSVAPGWATAAEFSGVVAIPR